MTRRPESGGTDRAGSFPLEDSMYAGEIASPIKLAFLYGKWIGTDLLIRASGKFSDADNCLQMDLTWPTLLIIRDWRDVCISIVDNGKSLNDHMVIIPPFVQWKITVDGDLPWVVGHLLHHYPNERSV